MLALGPLLLVPDSFVRLGKKVRMEVNLGIGKGYLVLVDCAIAGEWCGANLKSGVV